MGFEKWDQDSAKAGPIGIERLGFFRRKMGRDSTHQDECHEQAASQGNVTPLALRMLRASLHSTRKRRQQSIA